MEIGFAAHARIPIFGTHAPSDLTLREYVKVLPRLSEAIQRVEAGPRIRRPKGILIDPHASLEEAHDILERLKAAVTSRGSLAEAPRFYDDFADLQATLQGSDLMQ